MQLDTRPGFDSDLIALFFGMVCSFIIGIGVGAAIFTIVFLSVFIRLF
jgi:hypothetical protein